MISKMMVVPATSGRMVLPEVGNRAKARRASPSATPACGNMHQPRCFFHGRGQEFGCKASRNNEAEASGNEVGNANDSERRQDRKIEVVAGQ